MSVDRFFGELLVNFSLNFCNVINQLMCLLLIHEHINPIL